MVTADKINMSDLRTKRASAVGMASLIKSSQDNWIQLGGPAARRSSHAHSHSMFVSQEPSQLRSSMPPDIQRNILKEIKTVNADRKESVLGS